MNLSICLDISLEIICFESCSFVLAICLSTEKIN